jgi:putative flippase GtrA
VRIRLNQSGQFIRYCAVEALGVVVDTGLLVALRRSGLGLEFASPVAVEASIAFNYFFNDLWTFRARSRDRQPSARFLRFHLAAGIAGLINHALLLLLVRSRVWYVASNLFGIASASLVNYAINAR